MLRHRALDAAAGGVVLVKPEPLQITGSFKLRGATNAALLLDDAARRGHALARGGDAGLVQPCRRLRHVALP
ncbi:pyridoxal-phosphate dependent enzyme [Roseococcus sp. SYP-B2431]|nr:pyridoxal-phosphate dependent enzyme [Roseococcus sp. SYP-B2431]